MVFKLADVKDVPAGKAIVVQAPDGKEIALFNLNGQICALDNACPHMGGPLGEGEIENDIVTCPWHGWQFNICTGKCQNMPGEDAETINIQIRDGSIFL